MTRCSFTANSGPFYLQNMIICKLCIASPVALLAGIFVYLSACAMFYMDSTETIDSSCGLTKLRSEKIHWNTSRQQVINQERRMAVARYCRGLKSTKAKTMSVIDWNHLNDDKKPRLLFTDTTHLIVCETPKCGSSQWRNLMLILDGNIDGYAAGNEDHFDFSQQKNFMWRRYDTSDHAAAIAADMRLKKYYKIMTTREPLQRLVSAYRDKLETDSNPVYAPVSRNIHRTMNPNSDEGLASFEEFIDFILSVEDPTELDPHWKPYSALCDPCKIHYDYIARMETIYQDVNVITESIGTERDRIFNDTTGITEFQHRRNALTEQYFQQIPYSKRLAVFKYYQDQYDMFGYEYPSFIHTADIS